MKQLISHLLIFPVLLFPMLAPQPARAQGITISHSVNGETLTFGFATSLPADQEISVSVNRDYWEKGSSSRYTHAYFKEFSTVGEWSGKQELVDVSDRVWNRVQAAHQAEMRKLGIAEPLDRVSDKLEISVRTVGLDSPRVNQEIEISRPFGAPVETPTASLAPQDLQTGMKVKVSKRTPLMPLFEASGERALNALDSVRTLPPGTVLEIVQRRLKGTVPWYRVKTNIGDGWVNSTALLGQNLSEPSD